MSTAFIFPGQSSQYVGMGLTLYESFPESKALFDRADEILGFRITDACFHGPDETLKQTHITQPAIFVHSLAVASAIGGRMKADAAAGHSLGEYSALVYGGALSFETGLQLVILRGKLMQKAGEENKGTMAAIVGLTPAALEDVLKQASEDGVVQAANFNSPGQIVISGEVHSVQRAVELAKFNGAKLAKQLVVHGAFHSPLMSSAKDELKAALDTAEISNVKIPVYMNVTAKPVTTETPGAEIKNLLYQQLTSPVRWEETITNMVNEGVSEFVELGPGKVLQGLVKRINNSVRTSGFDTAEDLKQLIPP